MRNKIQSNKNTFLKRIFIKLCRFFNYEIIDQSNLEILTKNISANKNISIHGKKSITVPLGVTNIKKHYNISFNNLSCKFYT